MLSFDNVSHRYGSYDALQGIAFELREGELAVLLGANGAGKSTLFSLASGLRRPASGAIRFAGEDISGKSPGDLVRRGIVLCPEGRKLFPRMSVLQNLTLGAYVHRADKAGNAQRLEQVYALFPILQERRMQPAGSLSGGQQQMVAIGRALMTRPKTLLLDEPSMGLAPLVVQQVFAAIQAINRLGASVLLAEQNAYAALKIAHRGYVLESGRIVLQGDRDSLLRNDAVRRAYIGA